MSKHRNKKSLSDSAAAFTAIVSVVFFAGIALTILGAIMVRWDLQRQSVMRLERTRDGIMGVLNKDLGSLESALKAQRAFFVGSELVRRDEFYQFIAASGIADVYSGLVSFAYIPRVIAADMPQFLNQLREDRSVSDDGYPEILVATNYDDDEYWPITYVYPESELRQLIGFDYHKDALRRQTMEYARDSGLISLSAPTVLAGAKKRGALMIVPLYESATVPPTVSQRRALFTGALLIAIRIDDFLASVAPSTRFGQELQLEVIDIGTTGAREADILLANQVATARTPNWLGSLFERARADAITIVGGREWLVSFGGLPGYGLSKAERILPFVVLSVGFLLSASLALIVNDWKRRRSLREARRENEMLRERQRFLQALSAKLQTSVTAVFWAAKKLQKPQAQKRVLRDMTSQSKYIQKTMERLSYFFLLDADEAAQTSTDFSVSSQVKKAVRELTSDAEEKKLEMIVASEKNDRVHARLESFYLALSILVENAIEYNKVGGQVIVKVVPETDQVMVRVIDSGIGIPKSDQRHMFQPFFRAANAMEAKEAGSGTSLYLAKLLVDAAGGNITFESREGSGSVFILRIPRGMS